LDKKQLLVMIPKELHKRFKEYAEVEKTSMSDLVEKMIRKELGAAGETPEEFPDLKKLAAKHVKVWLIDREIRKLKKKGKDVYELLVEGKTLAAEVLKEFGTTTPPSSRRPDAIIWQKKYYAEQKRLEELHKLKLPKDACYTHPWE